MLFPSFATAPFSPSEDTTLSKATKRPTVRNTAVSPRPLACRAAGVPPGSGSRNGSTRRPGRRARFSASEPGPLGHAAADHGFDEAADKEFQPRAHLDAEESLDEAVDEEQPCEPTGEDSQIDDPVRIYLMQMGEIPMLSRGQEMAVAKQIKHGRRTRSAIACWPPTTCSRRPWPAGGQSATTDCGWTGRSRCR